MKTVEGFRRLGEYFHQDAFVRQSSVEAATQAFAHHLDAGQIEELIGFLEVGLDGKTDAELVGLWKRAGSDILVPTRSLRKFLTAIHDTLKLRRG